MVLFAAKDLLHMRIEMPIVKVSTSGFLCPTWTILFLTFQNSMINLPNITPFWRCKKMFLCTSIGKIYGIEYFALNTNF